MNETAKRSSNFELLRIFAMLMIVACHYSVHGIRHVLFPGLNTLWLEGTPTNKMFTSFLINGGNIGNGIFFMLTGYFMFWKECKIRRLVKLLCEVYFYAFLMLFVWVFVKFLGINNLSGVGTVSLIINALIPITSGAWWFVQTYFLLFLFIPVLNPFLEKLTSKQFIMVLCFVWLFWLAPKIFNFWYSNLQMAIFFYILGAGLKKSDFTVNKWLSLLLFCLVWLALSIMDMNSSFVLSNNTFIQKIFQAVWNVVTSAALVPLAVVFIFEFCKGLYFSNDFINAVASTTLGVYLIHDSSVSRPLIWDNIFHCVDVQYKSPYFPFFAIATIIIVFCVSSVIDWLRQTLFEKKVLSLVNKFIDNFFADKTDMVK